MPAARSLESFWRSFNSLVPPHAIEQGADYHFFIKGVRPTWEDRMNANGGRWVINSKDGELLANAWRGILMGLVGEQVGAVVAYAVASAVVVLWLCGYAVVCCACTVACAVVCAMAV